MKTILSYGITSICLIAALGSCKKDNSPGGQVKPPPVPVRTARGTATGTAVTKTIGAGGGSLTSTDGKLTVTVPAGTVSANTTFSIQPISCTLPGREGKAAYRLLPEGNAFAKRISVTYHYNDADFRSSKEDLLSACYQTAEGNWKLVATSLNKANKTLTLTTDHFSDWVINTLLDLDFSKLVASVHDQIDVTITGFSTDNQSLLAPMDEDHDMSGSIKSVSGWEVVNKLGMIAGKKDTMLSATYRPPFPLKHGDTALIQVVVKGNIIVPDSSVPGGKRVFPELVLIKPLQLVNENYMTGSFLDQPILASDATAYGNAGQMIINASMSTDSSVINYSVQISGASAAGDFPCGDLLLPGNAEVVASGTINQQPVAYTSAYMKCGPPITKAYSGSTVRITNWGPIGTYITGYYYGPLYKVPDECSPPSKGITMNFRAKRIL